jgi:hypothetical protein
MSNSTSTSTTQPTVTVKLGNVLPLNQKVLASLDSRNVAAHPWHDLEIGEPRTSITI